MEEEKSRLLEWEKMCEDEKLTVLKDEILKDEILETKKEKAMRLSKNWKRRETPAESPHRGEINDSQLQDEKEEIEGGNPPIAAKIKPPRLNLNVEADTIRNKAEVDQIGVRGKKTPEKIPPKDPNKSPVHNTRKHPNYTQPQSTKTLGGDAIMIGRDCPKELEIDRDCNNSKNEADYSKKLMTSEGVIGKICPKQIDPGKGKAIRKCERKPDGQITPKMSLKFNSLRPNSLKNLSRIK